MAKDTATTSTTEELETPAAIDEVASAEIQATPAPVKGYDQNSGAFNF